VTDEIEFSSIEYKRKITVKKYLKNKGKKIFEKGSRKSLLEVFS